MGKNNKPLDTKPLERLSVVIPARDEAGCIAATLQHLHLELSLNSIPHEIVVVDDGSSDDTWAILQSLRSIIPTLVPVQNNTVLMGLAAPWCWESNTPAETPLSS